MTLQCKLMVNGLYLHKATNIHTQESQLQQQCWGEEPAIRLEGDVLHTHKLDAFRDDWFPGHVTSPLSLSTVDQQAESAEASCGMRDH